MRISLLILSCFSSVMTLSILISVSLSSRTHVSGILEIAKELTTRGHQIHYASTTKYLKYAKGFNVKLHELTNFPEDIYDSFMGSIDIKQKAGRGVQSLQVKPELLEFFYRDHKINFQFISDLISNESFDVIICDFLSQGCRDAANFYNVPMIIGLQSTFAFGLFDLPYMKYSMEEGPTNLEKSSFFERFYDLTVNQIKANKKRGEFISVINKARKELGLPLNFRPYGPLDRNLVLSVSFFGFEPAIHTPPNVRLVGPIQSSISQSLDKELENFIQSKNNIIYIGFGSLSNILPEDSDDILKGLNILLDSGVIDGVIWGLGKSLINQTIYSSIKMIKWAPQKAILNSIKTKLFISHCGIESIFETIEFTTPILCLPFFGDQPINAIKIEEIGIGLNYPRKASNPELFASYVNQILEDTDKNYYTNLSRLKTISNLRSRHGTSDGANLIEEYAYLAQACRPQQSKDTLVSCEVMHLIPPNERMGFVKSNNLDIYFFLWSISALIIFGLVYSAYRLFKFIFKTSKLKSD